jgi:hypothetical protein
LESSIHENNKWLLTILTTFSISLFIPNFFYLEVFAQETETESLDILELETIMNIAAGITVAAAFGFQGYEIMMSRKERKLTFRAWVGEAGAHLGIRRYFNEKGEVVVYNDWNAMSSEKKKEFAPTELEWFINLQNFGQLPAFVRGRVKLVEEKIPKRNIIESMSYSPEFIIMPQAAHEFLFPLTVKESKSIEDTSIDTFLIIDIIYRSADEKKHNRSFGFIARLGQGSYNIEDSWTDVNS